MPFASPQTLKSIVPSASSSPRISVRITASSSIFFIIDALSSSLPRFRFSGSSSPIATPATALFKGTPASYSARQPPHTDPIEDDPHDSVMRLSRRMV